MQAVEAVRPREAARLVHQKMVESKAAYGHLDERKIGLMLEFTKFLFKCPRSLIAIEPDSAVVYLCPVINAEGPEVFFTQEQWDAAIKTFEVRRHEPALPKFFSLTVHSIEFIREIYEKPMD
jgi:hypothetical protein